ncbi:MAG: DUF1569 domain-containing protein [Bacteroidia bacterium]|nr:DUF1569 domain-containing protein [Bacteroidia bacterium]
MKTIFDKNTISILIDRISLLTAEDKAHWGKMDAFQMLKHCNLSEEMFLGKRKYDRLFIGKLFGKMALKGIMKDSEPMKKNQPTHPDFKIKGTGNFKAEKENWISLLKEYDKYTVPEFIHPFFGRMTKEEVGNYVYKHTDHHLRQFGK